MEISNITNNYPGIFEKSDTDLLRQEKILEELIKISEEYECLLKDCQETVIKVKKESANLQNQLNDLENHENDLYKECVEKTKAFHEIQNANQSILNEMEQTILKQQSPPLFTHQFPLHDVISKCQNYSRIVDLIIKKNFRLEGQIDQTTDEYTIDEYVNKLETIRKRYLSTYPRLIQVSSSYRARQHVIESIKSWNMNSLNLEYDYIQNQILSMNREINELTEYESILMDEINKFIENITNQKFELLMFDVNLIKIERAKRRKQLSDQILMSSNLTLHVAEILRIMLQNDYEYFESFNKYSKYEFNLNNECQQRIVGFSDISKKIC